MNTELLQQLINSSSVLEVLKTLTPREEKIIKMHYGLDSNTQWTIDKIANHFDIGTERATQIIHKAERKLQHPSRQKLLNKLHENRIKKDSELFKATRSGFQNTEVHCSGNRDRDGAYLTVIFDDNNGFEYAGHIELTLSEAETLGNALQEIAKYLRNNENKS